MTYYLDCGHCLTVYKYKEKLTKLSTLVRQTIVLSYATKESSYISNPSTRKWECFDTRKKGTCT